MSVAIGLLSCASFPDGSCDFIDVSQDLGTVLFAGPYAPQLTDSAKPPNENFTVQVPDSLPLGTASLNVAHFSLVGVSFS